MMNHKRILSLILCALFLISLTACSKTCEKIKLKTDEVILTEEGETYKLKVTVTPEDTTDELEFESDDEDVATVSESGKITAVGEGTTTITVTCGDESEECEVICDFGPQFSGGTTVDGVTTYKIGIAIYSFNDNFMTRYRQELEAYFEVRETHTVKFDLYLQDGQNDMSLQTAQIEAFIAQEMDLVILNPVTAASAEVQIAMLADAGIPVIVINREPPASVITGYPNTCYVGCDAHTAGYAQGYIIWSQDDYGDINGDGVVKYVMIVGDPENVDAQYRTESATQILIEAGISVECLVQEAAYWDSVTARGIAADAIAEYGDEIDVIICNNDGMAMGAFDAITAAGLEVGEDLYLVGIDATDMAVEMVYNGEMTGTVANDYVGQCYTVLDVTFRILNGEQIDDYYWVEYAPVF